MSIRGCAAAAYRVDINLDSSAYNVKGNYQHFKIGAILSAFSGCPDMKGDISSVAHKKWRVETLVDGKWVRGLKGIASLRSQ